MLTQLFARVPVIFKSLTDRKLDAIDVLVRNHLMIESLFARFLVLGRLSERIPLKAAGFKRHQDQIFLRIRKELEKHMIAEEQIFYPACELHELTRAHALQSFEKHEKIKTLIRDLNEVSIDDNAFEPKLTLLMEDVIGHVREEEEMLFPRARKTFTQTQLHKMAREIRSHSKPTRRNTTKAA